MRVKREEPDTMELEDDDKKIAEEIKACHQWIKLV